VDILEPEFAEFREALRIPEDERILSSAIEEAVFMLRLLFVRLPTFPNCKEDDLYEPLANFLKPIFGNMVIYCDFPTGKNSRLDLVGLNKNGAHLCLVFEIKKARGSSSESDPLYEAALGYVLYCQTHQQYKPAFLVTITGPLVSISGAAWWKPPEAINQCLCVEPLASMDMAFHPSCEQTKKQLSWMFQCLKRSSAKLDLNPSLAPAILNDYEILRVVPYRNVVMEVVSYSLLQK